ncbi:hypothetical protein V9K97_13600 [Variovorax sp. CCNWLW186]|uniref:hypothetical protein n=1 Tax=Variovorax sp. CCNWLW186 TaxID=3127473 RepID=UPI000F9F0725
MTVTVTIEFVDGSYATNEHPALILATHDKLLQRGLKGRDLIDALLTDDWAAPPRKVTLGFLSEGKPQEIALFYT